LKAPAASQFSIAGAAFGGVAPAFKDWHKTERHPKMGAETGLMALDGKFEVMA